MFLSLPKLGQNFLGSTRFRGALDLGQVQNNKRVLNRHPFFNLKTILHLNLGKDKFGNSLNLPHDKFLIFNLFFHMESI
jgi:hypothetical protein